MNVTAHSLWLIPLPPLVAAAAIALTPKTRPGLAKLLALASMVISFAVSAFALAGALKEPSLHDAANFTWITFGDTTVRLGFLLDPLTGFMTTMVTFVGFLIFVFSAGYMKEDPNATRFFGFLSLFAAAMLGLLVANSLLLLFISWELVGLASYLLIGFWFHKPEAAAAAKKAFITTRIGDIGFFLGILWLGKSGSSLLFFDNGNGFLEPAALTTLAHTTVCGGLALSTVIGLLLFCGAAGKSGQVPLHVWLPDAMEGPTPVSALIHAATMVAAGVFLMARVFPLLSADQADPHAGLHALTVVAAIGALTALYGAFVAVAQNDIKRVLAFSTVSQLGYMMLAIGVGSWVAAIFHLLTHAFFKALLFLGAGSVIHAAHHEQDIRKLGGLAPKLRITFLTFAIGTLALQGVPFFFSGFWSKEGILHAAHAWHVSELPLLAGLIGVILTSFYMTRLVSEVFIGKGPRDPHLHHVHESPAVMTMPLVILAIGSVLVGFVGTPAFPWIQSKLAGVETPEFEFSRIFEGPGLMILSTLLVAIGIGAGLWLYVRKARVTAEALDPIEKAVPALHHALSARLFWDEFYDKTVICGFNRAAGAAFRFESWVVAGAVSAIAGLTRFLGFASKEFDEDVLNDGFDAVGAGLQSSADRGSKAQSGRINTYLRVLGAGFLALLLILTIGGIK